VGRRDREVLAVVLTHPEEVEPDLLGEHPLLDDVADHLRLMQRPTVRVDGDVAERVHTELDHEHHRRRRRRHARGRARETGPLGARTAPGAHALAPRLDPYDDVSEGWVRWGLP